MDTDTTDTTKNLIKSDIDLTKGNTPKAQTKPLSKPEMVNNEINSGHAKQDELTDETLKTEPNTKKENTPDTNLRVKTVTSTVTKNTLQKQ